MPTMSIPSTEEESDEMNALLTHPLSATPELSSYPGYFREPRWFNGAPGSIQGNFEMYTTLFEQVLKSCVQKSPGVFQRSRTVA